MKTTKIVSLLSITILALTLNSCVEDGNFSAPEIKIIEPNITPNSSITAIKSALKQEFTANNNLLYTFHTNEKKPTYVVGYVVSNDATGNFYKKLIVQDNAANPTDGIEIGVDNTSLSESYNVGQKIYIKLDGLSVSYDDGQQIVDPNNAIPGKYILGTLEGGRVDNIPSTSVKNHIFRSATVEDIIPTILTFSDFSEAHMNTLVTFESVQFEKSQLGKTFAGETYDSFDGFRRLFECSSNKKLLLQSSTFADFKSNIIPANKGNLTAILTKDFRAEFYVAIINTPSNIDFKDPNRCDPVILDCGTETIGGAKIIYNENFNGLTTNSDLTTSGWTNINTTGGSILWAVKSFNGNNHLQMSAFRTGENPLEAWLVTPAINLNASTKEELTFKTKTGYNNGAALSVYVSTNFLGDVTTATWQQLGVTLADGPSNGYSSNYTESGSVNISCLSGDVHVAFKYKGGDGDITTTFQLDDVKITGN